MGSTPNGSTKATIAQLVERVTCNDDVTGSTPVCGSTGEIKMGKIKQVIEKLKKDENLTTQEVLTKYPDLARLLEQEEQQEKLNESERERALLKG